MTLKAILNGSRTLTLDPSGRLADYQRKMAEQDRAQREAWARMLYQEYQQASRRNG